MNINDFFEFNNAPTYRLCRLFRRFCLVMELEVPFKTERANNLRKMNYALMLERKWNALKIDETTATNRRTKNLDVLNVSNVKFATQ